MFPGGIVYGLHRGDRVDRRDLGLAFAAVLNHEVTGQHQPDPIFQQQRLTSESRVASRQDAIIAKLGTDLFFSVSRMSISVRTPKPSAWRASLTRWVALSMSASSSLAMK